MLVQWSPHSKKDQGWILGSGGGSPPGTAAPSCDDGFCFWHEMTDVFFFTKYCTAIIVGYDNFISLITETT